MTTEQTQAANVDWYVEGGTFQLLSGLLFTSFSVEMCLWLHNRVWQVRKPGFIIDLLQLLSPRDKIKYTQVGYLKNCITVNDNFKKERWRMTKYRLLFSTVRFILYCLVYVQSVSCCKLLWKKKLNQQRWLQSVLNVNKLTQSHRKNAAKWQKKCDTFMSITWIPKPILCECRIYFYGIGRGIHIIYSNTIAIVKV